MNYVVLITTRRISKMKFPNSQCHNNNPTKNRGKNKKENFSNIQWHQIEGIFKFFFPNEIYRKRVVQGGVLWSARKSIRKLKMRRKVLGTPNSTPVSILTVSIDDAGKSENCFNPMHTCNIFASMYFIMYCVDLL